jgi:putative oxidoreductase
MSNLDSFYTTWTPRLLSVLRIVAAFLFIAHGTQKLFNYPASPNGAVAIASLMGVAGILEFFGGLLLLLGLLFTRPVAFVLAGQMAVAYFMAHAPSGFLPLVNRGEAAVLYCFIFLFLSVAGAGDWSVDRLSTRHRNEAGSPTA